MYRAVLLGCSLLAVSGWVFADTCNRRVVTNGTWCLSDAPCNPAEPDELTGCSGEQKWRLYVHPSCDSTQHDQDDNCLDNISVKCRRQRTCQEDQNGNCVGSGTQTYSWTTATYADSPDCQVGS